MKTTYNYIIFLFVVFTNTGCNNSVREEFDRGYKIYNIDKLKNKTGKEKIVWTTDSIIEYFDWKNGVLNGKYLKLSLNQDTIESGQYLDGIQVGIWKKKLSNNIIRFIEYKIIRGEKYLNQKWYYPSSDSLKKGEMRYRLYNEDESIKVSYDTPMSVDGFTDGYTLMFIAPFNDDFSNTEDVNIDTLQFNEDYIVDLPRNIDTLRAVIVDRRVIYMEGTSKERSYTTLTYIDTILK